MRETYTSRLCVSKLVKRIVQEDCKKHYREHHHLPSDLKVTDNNIMRSMIQHYLDINIDDGEE